MFDPTDDDVMISVIEPGEYIVAHGLGMGISDSMERDQRLICISIFDQDQKIHPIVMYPDDGLVQYLMSDAFRESLQELLDHIS